MEGASDYVGQKEAPRPEAAIGAGSQEARALQGLLTLRGGQFMFDCFQNLRARGLEERILADLTLRW